MSNYGRNFEFRASPHRNQRQAHFYLDDVARPIGVPVIVSGDQNSQGQLPVELATGSQEIPKNGLGGILVYEYAPVAFRGFDQTLTTFSDLDFAPAGAAVQVVQGDDVVVAYKNTDENDFFTRADYPKARVMVAGMGATPTVAVGDYLTPGVGTDADGYWAETATAANAWLIVTSVNAATGEVEAQINF